MTFINSEYHSSLIVNGPAFLTDDLVKCVLEESNFLRKKKAIARSVKAIAA